MNLSIFDIPHLKDGITCYLTTQDLIQGVLVSKQWCTWFNICLWRTIDTKFVDSHTIQSALVRNSRHVQIIITRDTFLSSEQATIPTFPNLRSLNYTATEQLCDEAHISHFLSAEQQLDKFKLRVVYLKQHNADILIRNLELQPKLGQLDLTVNRTWDPTFFPQILQACRSCHTLRVFIQGFTEIEVQKGEQYSKKYQALRATMEELQDMQLKDLTIRLSTIPQWLTILEPLLRHCPLLERLKLYDLFDRSTIQQVVQALEDNSCPQLRHLFLSDVVCHGEDDVAVDMIRAVMGCKGGDSGAGDNRIKASKKGLQSYELYNNSHFTPQCARALVEFHAGTLTALNLSVSYLVNFSVFIQVVGSLPNLVSLIASIRLRSKGEMDTERTESALQSTWSCAGLKTIHLSAMYKHQYSASSDGELVDRCAAYLLEQIGRQSGLQELRLEGSVSLKFMVEEYLTKFSGLKQLRQFGLDFGIDFPFGAEEAKWMVLNWPRLVNVTASFLGPFDGFETPVGLYKEFKATLLAERPWIVID